MGSSRTFVGYFDDNHAYTADLYGISVTNWGGSVYHRRQDSVFSSRIYPADSLDFSDKCQPQIMKIGSLKYIPLRLIVGTL